MEIIPVIDLLQGQVVRAERGERSRYRPIVSRLCDSCEPLAITRALLELYPFATLYIADLDAIQGRGDNAKIVEQLRRAFPQLTVWLDAGIRTPEDWPFPHDAGIRCVIGSESLLEATEYTHLAEQLAANAPLLSLDFNANGLIGPPALIQRPGLWPNDLICMTLVKVGSYAGPDMDRLSALRTTSPHTRVYAAGGIRNMTDLEHLRNAGISGALVASALHDGRISKTDLTRLKA